FARRAFRPMNEAYGVAWISRHPSAGPEPVQRPLYDTSFMPARDTQRRPLQSASLVQWRVSAPAQAPSGWLHPPREHAYEVADASGAASGAPGPPERPES